MAQLQPGMLTLHAMRGRPLNHPCSSPLLQIASLDGLSSLKKLKTLYMSNNRIRDWSELDKLVRPTHTNSQTLSLLCLLTHAQIVHMLMLHSKPTRSWMMYCL